MCSSGLVQAQYDDDDNQGLSLNLRIYKFIFWISLNSSLFTSWEHNAVIDFFSYLLVYL